MSNTDIDRILEDLFFVLPIFHKRLLRMDLGGVTGNLTRLHVAIMGTLKREGIMSVTDIAKVLVVPKSQMTHLIDQLVDADIVARHPVEIDRRVINIALTDRGQVILKDLKHKLHENIKQKLAVLSPEELTEMSQSLAILRKIGERL